MRWVYKSSFENLGNELYREGKNKKNKSEYSNSEIVFEYSNGMRIFEYSLTSLVFGDFNLKIPLILTISVFKSSFN